MRTTLLALVPLLAACTLQTGAMFPTRPAAVGAAPPAASAAPTASAASAAPAAPAAPARRRASPPPWNDTPAHFEPPNHDARNPGGRVHGKPWDCDAHDQCIHPASWFVTTDGSTHVELAYLLDGKLFSFNYNFEILHDSIAHRTRRARATDVVVGAPVFAWSGDDPPDSWMRTTYQTWWLFGTVREVDTAAGTFRIAGSDYAYRIDQARVSVERRAF